MAQTTADPMQKLEERLTCAVCLEVYKNPKGLPCQHNFCQDCLGPCPRVLEEGKYFLKCPTCRKPVQLPDGGVPALPPAFAIKSFLELHQEMLAKQDAMECPQHKKPLEAFCDTCQELVCFFCATRSHNSHCVRMISDIIHDCKQQLEKGLQPVKQQTATVMDAIKDLDTCDKSLVHQGEAVERQIHSQAQEARAAVDQAERKLIEEVRTAVQQKRGVIALQKQEVQDELARLQSSIAYVQQSIKVQSHQRIVASKTKLLDRIKASISQARETRLKPAESIDVKLETNQKAIEECKKLGVLRYSLLSEKCHLALRPGASGRKAHCELCVRHKDGSPLPISTSLISCHLTANNGPQPADCTITETGLGKYEIHFIPVICGPHQLRVMVGGTVIPRSPLSISVQPSSPEIRGQPLHTIQGLKQPTGVAVSKTGQVIVSEGGAHCITIFSSDLKQRRSVGSHGSERNCFNGPTSVAITDDDRILVADSGNNRIQVLSMEGQFLTSVESKGSLQFVSPFCIAVHSNGQVLLSERSSDRIYILNSDFTLSHTFVTHRSKRCKGEGHPGMVVDSQGVIYMADYCDGCILKFSIAGQFIAKVGSAEGQLYAPFGVVIDDSNHIYASDATDHRISMFTTKGKLVKRFEMPGGHRAKHSLALNALALNMCGNLYMCDWANNCLHIF